MTGRLIGIGLTGWLVSGCSDTAKPAGTTGVADTVDTAGVADTVEALADAAGDGAPTPDTHDTQAGEAAGEVPDAGPGADATPDTPGVDTGPVGCNQDPEPPGTGTCPPECTGGCAAGVCTIDCVGEAKCSSLPGGILCPPDYACVVVCEQLDACDSIPVYCPADYACAVHCDAGKDACGDLELHCGDASCRLTCGSPSSVCDGATVICGPGECKAECQEPAGGPNATQPKLFCGNTCGCTAC
jgi:hypothetical protein